MNYTQATDLIRSHTDYGGSVDVHALALAMSGDASASGQTDAEALHDAWQSTFAHMDAVVDEPKLTVWYGSMPESNGKTNWTAILHRGDVTQGITLDMSEYPDRVRYEADRMRWMIGELAEKPFILDYDADKHSGYVAPPPAKLSTETVDKGVDRLTEARIDWIANAHCPGGIAYPSNVKNAIREALLAASDSQGGA